MIFLLFISTPQSHANDAFSGLSTGGVEFQKSNSILMKSEELYLSSDQIKVTYDFENVGNASQEVTVSFPLPSVSAYDKIADEVGHLDFSLLTSIADSFEVVADGKKIPFKKEMRAVKSGKDITDQLKALGLDPTNSGKDGKILSNIATKDIDKLLQEGWVEKLDDHLGPGYPDPYFRPLWAVEMKFFWEQVFPPHKTVHVQHKYQASRSYSQLCFATDEMSEGKVHQLAGGETKKVEDEFCVDSQTRSGINKLIQAARKKQASKPAVDHFCGSVKYILTSAKTWFGPIKNFHLILDKPKNSIVSTCFPDIKKVNATRFEAHLKNFVPDRELDVLFVEAPGL